MQDQTETGHVVLWWGIEIGAVALVWDRHSDLCITYAGDKAAKHNMETKEIYLLQS